MSFPSFEEMRRREYPELDGIFFNAASYGLLPRRAVEASNDLTARRNRPGGVREEELGEALWRCRRAAAALVGAEADEITLAPNTSYGVNLAAHLLRGGPPGTVLLSAGEFSANVYPWMALEADGFRVEVMDADAEGRPREQALLERLRGEDVRALALSAVQFSTGYQADLRRLATACREHDVLFAVDAIQALGAVPVDVKALGIDVLASGGQKWLCGPWGSGFVYLDPNLHDRFDPPMVSWLAFEASSDFESLLDYRYEFLPDARKFELATLGIQDYLALAHSLELFVEMGIARIREHLFAVQEPLLAWIGERDDVTLITPAERAGRAGIVAFRPPEIEEAAAALREAGVSFARREGLIRFSPHFYNTVEEMEEAVAALAEGVRPEPGG